jgi:hypothetical protein
MSSPVADNVPADIVPDLPNPVGSKIDPLAYEAANHAFERELPELMKLRNYKRRWVMYHCGTRMGIAATKTELHQLARRRGLPLAEIVVRYITDTEWSADLEILSDV